MTVGETLTEARSQAGLTVDELSERTRIRGTVIRSIEQDDYAACGGDLYVRGYVRALAGAVGIDAQPLIREYELGRVGPDGERGSGPTGRHAKGYHAVAAPDVPTAFDLPPVPDDPIPAVPAEWADESATRFDLPPVTSDPTATAFDLPVVPPVPPATVPPAAALPPGSADTRFDLPPVTDDPMAAGYVPWPQAEPDQWPQAWPGQPGDATAVIPALGHETATPQDFGPAGGAGPGSGRRKRGVAVAAVAGLVVLVALGALGVRLATSGAPARSTAAVGAPQASASAAAARASAAAQASAAASASAAQASASASQASASAAASSSAAQAVTALPVASAVAFGPDGPADGDDPGGAKYAINGGASQSWSTQWYATAQFGMLKHGTGLLLDLGGSVTVSSVVIDLSKYQGTVLEIRAGNGTAPQDLAVVATASNVGGVVRLTLPRPPTARYLLVWFTQLPPDGAGHYQETVSHVQVTGRR